MKTKSTKYYVISFDDISQTSRKGLGFETQIIADSEEEAREIFEDAYPDCEIQEVREDNFAIVEHRMTLNEYQEKAMQTCLPSADNFEYMMLNLVGEVGELASKIAKGIRKEEVITINNNLYSKDQLNGWSDEFEFAIQKEAGDILWQLAGLCSWMHWDLETIAKQNLDKLAARKKAGTIDGNGDGVIGKERTV